MTPAQEAAVVSPESPRWVGLLTLERLKDVLVPLGLLPVIAAFLKYAYQAGAAASFHIPIELVRPDLTGVYGLLLLMIPIVLLIAIIGVASQPTEMFVRTQMSSPKTTPLWLRFVARLYLVLVYAVAASTFYEPMLRWKPVFVSIVIFCGLAIVLQGLLFIVQTITRNRALASGATVDERDPVVRNGLALGVLGFICMACAFTYATGFRTSRSETWHYVLPGRKPEVALLMQTDGYVTANYQPRTRIFSATFRWRDWKEHRSMDLVYTGVLPAMTALTANDDQLLVPEPPEPRAP